MMEGVCFFLSPDYVENWDQLPNFIQEIIKKQWEDHLKDCKVCNKEGEK
jgi:hypothetical protein